MLKRFIPYYKPHLKLFALDMLASFFIAALGMVYPMVTRRMLNEYIPLRAYREIIFAGALVLGLYVLRFLLRYFVQYYGHIVGVRMQAEMRRELFSHLEKLPYSYYDEHETGKIMSRLTSDLNEVSELAHHGPENLFISGIMVVWSFFYLYLIHPYLTLIVFACVPFLVAVTLISRRKMRAAFTERRAATAEISGAIESSISGIRVTKAFTGEETETKKFDKGNEYFVESSKDAYRAMAVFFSSTSFVTDVFNVIVLIAGGLFLYAGDITFGDYSTFVVSINLFISPIMTLVNFSEQFQNGATGFRRFLEVMDTPPETDTPDARPLSHVKGEIEFRDVSFSYENSKEVIRNMSFTVKAGEKFALVGPSGGGKTTVCHLLPAFYRQKEGDIFIDGKELRSLTLHSLRANIGIVQQDVFLFSGSFRDNIRYGRPDATDAEVEAAAKNANIHEYIMTLPKGYDTEIGERGVKLSGGQKQRLSIARVFLKNPAILILDEATSALDNTTEILIQSALDRLCEGRTTVVVAHRLSTVKNADRIAVIREGEIAEIGSHDALMEKEKGIYRTLYDAQFSGRLTTEEMLF